MSVQALCTHIEELSSEIHVQKQFLEKLEPDKSLVQRELNAALDLRSSSLPPPR
jgi:hypothetical protein